MVHCFFVIERSKDMAHRWRALARLGRFMDSADYIIFWQSVNRKAPRREASCPNRAGEL